MVHRDAMRLDQLTSYVATVASTRMLAWLHAAFSRALEVEKYLDPAGDVPSILPDGPSCVSEAILKPRVTFHPKSRGELSALRTTFRRSPTPHRITTESYNVKPYFT